MSDIDLFDLDKTDDLGENVIGELKANRTSSDLRKVLSLFEIKDTLSIDQILVGLKRKYNLEKKRSWISSNLWNLGKRGLIEVVKGKKGVYRKKD